MSINTGSRSSGADDAAHVPNDLIDLLGGRLERVARMGREESDTVLFRTRLKPGQAVPLHSHIDPECFYVLSGCLEVFLVDEAPRWRLMEAGRSVLAGDGIRHAIRNPADEIADLMVMTNNRLARFFREAGRPVEPGIAFVPPAREDFERVAQVANAYGYWLSSPAENASITG